MAMPGTMRQGGGERRILMCDGKNTTGENPKICQDSRKDNCPWVWIKKKGDYVRYICLKKRAKRLRGGHVKRNDRRMDKTHNDMDSRGHVFCGCGVCLANGTGRINDFRRIQESYIRIRFWLCGV